MSDFALLSVDGMAPGELIRRAEEKITAAELAQNKERPQYIDLLALKMAEVLDERGGP